MPYGIRDDEFSKIVEVLRSLPQIEEAIIFGSRAKGTHKRGSDIDIAVKGSITLSVINKLLESLDALFLPYTFDIVGYAEIESPALREHIDRVGRLLLAREII